MFFVLLFFSELLILFFLSRQVTRALSYVLYRITNSERVMIHLMALMFFPGTLIHELAHAITAMLLFVHVGKMEFVPKVIGHGVKMGSVAIGHCDPMRRALIGLAPFFWGTALILLVLYAFTAFGGLQNIGITILTGYILFEISNTMFSSRKDMEGSLELLLAIFVAGLIFYLLGFRFPHINIEALLDDDTVRLFQTGSYFLGVPLILDIGILAVLRLVKSVIK